MLQFRRRWGSQTTNGAASSASGRFSEIGAKKEGGRSHAPKRKATPPLVTPRRRRRRGGREQDEDDDGEKDGNDDGSYGMPFFTGRRQQEVLACPFYKYNSIRHMNCGRLRLSRIRDVKQHLVRRHRRPPHCPVCGTTFDDSERCDSHIMARDCHAPLGGVTVEGVTETQRDALTGRVDRALNEPGQWFSVWDILFPNSPRPHSPYLSTDFEGVLGILHDYWEREGDELIAEAVQPASSDSGSGSDIGRLVADLSSRVVDNLFSRFRMASQAIANPTHPDPATRGISGTSNFARRPPRILPSPLERYRAASRARDETTSTSMAFDLDFTSLQQARDAFRPTPMSSTSSNCSSQFDAPYFDPLEEFWGSQAISAALSADSPGFGLDEADTWLTGGFNGWEFQAEGTTNLGELALTSSNLSLLPEAGAQHEIAVGGFSLGGGYPHEGDVSDLGAFSTLPSENQ